MVTKLLSWLFAASLDEVGDVVRSLVALAIINLSPILERLLDVLAAYERNLVDSFRGFTKPTNKQNHEPTNQSTNKQTRQPTKT